MSTPTTVTWNDDPTLLFLDRPVPWQKQKCGEIMVLANRLRQSYWDDNLYDRDWRALQDAVYALMPPITPDQWVPAKPA